MYVFVFTNFVICVVIMSEKVIFRKSTLKINIQG